MSHILPYREYVLELISDLWGSFSFKKCFILNEEAKQKASALKIPKIGQYSKRLKEILEDQTSKPSRYRPDLLTGGKRAEGLNLFEAM